MELGLYTADTRTFESIICKIPYTSGRKGIISLMWGINGSMSVVGSALSIILSMTFGFSAAIVAGIAIYLAVGVFIRI
ncbi:MAG: hypothetical protein FWH52_02015 [Synergistaceae bacterium]|nr:hypothetical protein [Synergistaceae bacterium]